MKILGIKIGSNSSSKDTPSITEADKKWVENQFKWVIRVFGYPNEQTDWIVFEKKYFPETFQKGEVSVASLITDLSKLLSLDESKISYELERDIRDISNTPYVIYGKSFESELEIIKENGKPKQYILYVANKLTEDTYILLIRIIFEMVEIKLAENGFYFKNEENTPLAVYFLSIYFGFGQILSSKLHESRVSYIAGWERTWKYNSGMPYQVMAYALATFTRMISPDNPKIPDGLSKEMKKEFDSALEYLNKESTSILFDKNKLKNEFEVNEITRAASLLYRENKFEQAINEVKKVIAISYKSNILALNYNNIGYYKLRLKKYEDSIPDFLKAIEINPEYGYAYDNLGFAYIMLGELEKGKESIVKAMATESDDKAYSFRNLGIYHMKKNEMEEAEEYFQKAFEMKTRVDLLEYFYAQFFFQKGNKKEGMRYLEKAVEKGEPEAIEFIEGLNE